MTTTTVQNVLWRGQSLGLAVRSNVRRRQCRADPPHPLGLLRAPSERPCCRRAAEERDELAPSQLIELHLVPASQGRIAGYRIGEEQSAGIGALAKPVSAPLEASLAK